MLGPDPKRRLTAQEVLDHPWLQNAKKAPNVPLDKLKRKALRVIAEHLSVEEMAGIREMFDMMDTNQNGQITLEELKVGFIKICHHVPDPDLHVLMDAADVDGNGLLDYGELIALSVHLKKIDNDEHLRKAFMYFNQNKSGYIEIEDLRSCLADDLGTNTEVVNATIHEVDTDKDGRISYEEFAAMMKAGTDWRKASRPILTGEVFEADGRIFTTYQ